MAAEQQHHAVSSNKVNNASTMKGSPCCAGLMRSCLHTYRTKTNLTQHIIQPWGGGHQPSMGGPSVKYGGGAISQVWGGSSTNYGGAISQVWGGSSTNYGGGPSAKYGGGGIFPPVCTGSQNPQNYFSNTYVLPSVNRTPGPTRNKHHVLCNYGLPAVPTYFPLFRSDEIP